METNASAALAIRIFLWKQYKYHRHNWRVLLVNIALALFVGIVLVVVYTNDNKPTLIQCEPMHSIAYFWFVEILVSLVCLNVLLLPIVHEKQSGVKEFMRMSCRYSYWNLVTLYVLQVVINLFIFGVVLGTASALSINSHYDMKYMVILVILYVNSNVAFCFALSALFNTGKLCNGRFSLSF